MAFVTVCAEITAGNPATAAEAPAAPAPFTNSRRLCFDSVLLILFRVYSLCGRACTDGRNRDRTDRIFREGGSMTLTRVAGLISLALIAFAQTERGNISGIVSDPQ